MDSSSASGEENSVMENESMHDAKLVYVFKYFSHLMTKHEAAANGHLWVTAKNQGRTDVEAQVRAKLVIGAEVERLVKDEDPEIQEIGHRKGSFWLSGLSDDPDVLRLAANGYPAFVRQTGQRILEQHRVQLTLNCCPKCGGVARTPTARQCRFCWHDWHTS